MTLQLKTKKKKKIKISGKADKIEINPELTEGVASIRNDILNKIGASRSRTKQWIRTPTGKIRIETF